MHGPTSVGWSSTRARTTGEETAGNIFSPPCCFVRGDRIELVSLYPNCYLHTDSVTSTAAGASSHNSYPIAQILAVNQPRGFFSGGGVASHVGVWRRVAPIKCIRFINSTHTRKRRAYFSLFGLVSDYPGREHEGVRRVSKPMVMGADAYLDSW